MGRMIVFMTQSVTAWVLAIAMIITAVVAIYGVLHAIRTRPDAFPAAGKQSKPLWLMMLTASVVLGLLISLPTLLGTAGVALPFILLLSIFSISATSVYIVDVRPKLEEVQRPNW